LVNTYIYTTLTILQIHDTVEISLDVPAYTSTNEVSTLRELTDNTKKRPHASSPFGVSGCTTAWWRARTLSNIWPRACRLRDRTHPQDARVCRTKPGRPCRRCHLQQRAQEL